MLASEPALSVSTCTSWSSEHRSFSRPKRTAAHHLHFMVVMIVTSASWLRYFMYAALWLIESVTLFFVFGMLSLRRRRPSDRRLRHGCLTRGASVRSLRPPSISSSCGRPSRQRPVANESAMSRLPDFRTEARRSDGPAGLGCKRNSPYPCPSRWR